MTSLVAIAEPDREHRKEPTTSAMLLSALLHVAVLLLFVVAVQLMPQSDLIPIPEERAIEVVMVQPQETPQPQAQPQPETMVLERPNLSRDSAIGAESAAPASDARAQPDAPAADTPPAPAEPAAPAPAAAAAVRPEPPQPTPEPPPAQPTPQPAPPRPAPVAAAPPPTHFEINPRDIRSFESPIPPNLRGPPAAQPLPQPPPQVARATPQQPPPQVARPQPTNPTGELREVDLFGRGRLPPRQAAAAAAPPRTNFGSRGMTTEGAFILRQVLRAWTVDYRNERYRDIILRFRMMLQADGTLTYPWGRNDPWMPQRMIENYQELLQPGMDEIRRIAESFAYTLRAAQPFELPPSPGGYPRQIGIAFRFGDL